VMSVKSIQPKEYELEEDALLAKLEGIAVATGQPAEETITVGKFERSFRVEPQLLSWERVETGSEPLLSDLKYGGAIMQYLADFERKQCTGKKVIFFFSQAEAFEDCVMDDIAKWYFGMRHEVPIFGANDQYAKMFKTREGVVEHQGSIVAIACMLRPSSVLLWPPNCAADERRGKKRLMIFGKDVPLMRELSALLVTPATSRN